MPDPFISSDAASVEFARISLQEAVKGDPRTQLEALRDYLAHQLEANLCNSCLNSRLRTGDQAALVQKLKDTLADINSLPSGKETNRLDRIRGHLGIVADGDTDSQQVLGAPDPSQQQRTGSRRPGGGRRSEA